MTALLSKSHRILDKGFMECRPFGKESTGEKIRDVSGITVRANVEYLEEVVSRAQDPEAGAQAVEELTRLLNERIRERAFHVSPEFLKNPWNSYSYEFVMFFAEFCVLLSKDQNFHFNLGREKFLSPIIQVLGRPFSITQIYKLYPHFVEKYTKGALHPEVVSVTSRTAVIRLTLSEKTVCQFGPYRLSCASIICQGTKATIAEVPARMFGLKPATIEERSCMGDGADCCEWQFTWEPLPSQTPVWSVGGLALGGVGFAYVYLWYPTLSLSQSIGLACMLIVTAWLAQMLWTSRRRIKEREQIIQEQLHAAEVRHEELREVYSEQEQILVELRRRVGALTMLHQNGLRLSSTRDRDLLMATGLQAIVQDLHYDRAMLTLYDPSRGVAHGACVLGVSEAHAAVARAVHVPITDPESVEGTVLLKGTPVLIDNVEEIQARLHPLTQQVIDTMQTKAFIAVPLKVEDRILGAMVADRVQAHSLTQDDVNLLVTAGNQIAVALDNADAYAQIERLNIGLEAKVRERTAELEQLNQKLETANERLQEIDRLKSQFLSHCSHELRTPLTLIKGFVENLIQGYAGPLAEKQQVVLTRVNASVDRQTRMIADLLDLLRIEAGTIQLRWKDVDLPKLGREVVEELQLLAQSRGQHIEMVCPEQALTIVADHDRVNQIVMNLIDNAVKFTPKDGTIRVQIERAGADSVLLSVTDSGPGIPSEAIPQLFEPFFQAHRQQEIGAKGLGLGLAIVKQLVDLHGGTIGVQSEVGQGTTFRVTLPYQQRCVEQA